MLSEKYYKDADEEMRKLYVKRYFAMRDAMKRNDEATATYERGYLDAMYLLMNMYTLNVNVNVLKDVVVGMYEENRNGD